jgi:putative oxidoreductase
MMMTNTPNATPSFSAMVDTPQLLVGYSQASVGYSLPLLFLRATTGLAFIWHGLPKIVNPFHWMGDALPSTIQMLPAVAEFAGGIALMIGLFSPIASFFLVMNMTVALILGHFTQGHPFVALDPHQHSYELALVYWCISLFILVNGPGRYSLDYLFFKDFFKLPSFTKDKF